MFPAAVTVLLMLLRNAKWTTASGRISLAVASSKPFILLVVRNPSGPLGR
jgi:hypothetical protein